MKRVLLLLIIALFAVTFMQCSDDDNTAATCKLLKWNPYKYGNDTIYLNEHVYESNRLVANIVKTLPNGPFPISLLQTSVNAVVYDAAWKVVKVDSEYELDEFLYAQNSSRPNARNHYRKVNGIPGLEYTEDITYDGSGRIIKTVQFNDNESIQYHATLTTTYEYVNNNLYRYAESSYVTTPNYTYSYESVTYFESYDDKKNPFKNYKSPFVAERQLQFSKNNWTSMRKVYLDDEGNEEDTGAFESRTYGYNESGYPLPGVYDCN